MRLQARVDAIRVPLESASTYLSLFCDSEVQLSHFSLCTAINSHHVIRLQNLLCAPLTDSEFVMNGSRAFSVLLLCPPRIS